VTWGGWSWEALQDWGQYLKLGIPGILGHHIILCVQENLECFFFQNVHM
jgi:hypothetical protein